MSVSGMSCPPMLFYIQYDPVHHTETHLWCLVLSSCLRDSGGLWSGGVSRVQWEPAGKFPDILVRDVEELGTLILADEPQSSAGLLQEEVLFIGFDGDDAATAVCVLIRKLHQNHTYAAPLKAHCYNYNPGATPTPREGG